MLEKKQATHQTNQLTGATIVLTIQRPESRIELLPLIIKICMFPTMKGKKTCRFIKGVL
ncbi:hypothetical protein PORCRE_298 [Porphyromonas crevioricanis JCM 15906]|uniref:Uncharacterized protein n=1 Tax=Porphyromonas crevioricanis JCM 15906 TaxID=1305617 RepID=T1CND7_9PORP|nr:hypothetical protein PORCRE_298 [Porphyromonas crevioricanis JCM 15906]GAD07232.1 hypothetical protein PORCAN_851 [Porphyromonas crevioricanis JCM 13913]